uniref:RING-type E3 ubiquitin transferase n=1 Tax=Eptatretus burgeri TaxID=7764 RepID=A0A8C4NDE2_EPTBU
MLLEHKAGAHPEDTLPLDECVCSICLDIYVEPVTMPCQHTLCMPCFQENCAKVNLRCPMCRRRVSTWMRKAVRNAGLVNRSLWDRVRRSYPQLCQRRLNGQDSIMDEDYYHSPPRLCEPGEMRQEFENMLRKYEEERRKEDELERRMSEEYIAHLLATNKHRSIGSNHTKTLWQVWVFLFF